MHSKINVCTYKTHLSRSTITKPDHLTNCTTNINRAVVTCQHLVTVLRAGFGIVALHRAPHALHSASEIYPEIHQSISALFMQQQNTTQIRSPRRISCPIDKCVIEWKCICPAVMFHTYTHILIAGKWSTSLIWARCGICSLYGRFLWQPLPEARLGSSSGQHVVALWFFVRRMTKAKASGHSMMSNGLMRYVLGGYRTDEG